MGNSGTVIAVRRIAVLVLMVCAGTLLAAQSSVWPFGPRRYRSPAATFEIVDPQGQPIDGAIALLSWVYMQPNGHSETFFNVFEAQSDSAGKILIPELGPFDTPPGTRVIESTPLLSVFKPGYLPFFDTNKTGEAWEEAPPTLGLIWDHTKITLVPADRKGRRYLDQIQALARTMYFYLEPGQCWARSFHDMLDTLNAELDLVLPPDIASPRIAPNSSGC